MKMNYYWFFILFFVLIIGFVLLYTNLYTNVYNTVIGTGVKVDWGNGPNSPTSIEYENVKHNPTQLFYWLMFHCISSGSFSALIPKNENIPPPFPEFQQNSNIESPISCALNYVAKYYNVDAKICIQQIIYLFFVHNLSLAEFKPDLSVPVLNVVYGAIPEKVNIQFV